MMRVMPTMYRRAGRARRLPAFLPVVIPVGGLLDVLYHFVGHVTPGVI